MKFLELHHPTENTPILIATDKIVFVTANDKSIIEYTYVGTVDGNVIEVKESYEEIMRWLLTI